MKATPVEIGIVLEQLMATPQQLQAAASALPVSQLVVKPGPGAWSVQEILAHLRCCADVWGSGIASMLRQETRVTHYISPRSWIKKTNYLSIDFGVSLSAYSKQRLELIQVLQTLKPEVWEYGGIFSVSGKEREETVFRYARRMAYHEKEHLEQIREQVNKP